MLTKSIRWRMQLWQGFLLLLVLSGFGVTAYQLHRTNGFSEIDAELERRLAAVSADARGVPRFRPEPGAPPFGMGPRGKGGPMELEKGPDGPPDHERFPFRGPRPDWKGPPAGRFEDFMDNREVRLSPVTLNLFSETGTNDFYYVVWNRTGSKRLIVSTNAPADLQLPMRVNNSTVQQVRLREHSREAFLFTEIGECVLVGRAVTADLIAMRNFGWMLGLVGAVVLAVGLGGGWLLASRALRPVEEISAAASRISLGNLAERINLAETDSELGRLAAVLNSTFARLEGAFAQQKQFSADASHELRTPLAVIISEGQSTLARDRSPAEYREALETCVEAAQEMKKLTQSLLELARFDAGQAKLERRNLALADVVGPCVEMIAPLARERGIEIRCDLQKAVVFGDSDRLAQVVTNLLSNAIQYNGDHGRVSVLTRAEAGTGVLEVSDTGVGIASKDLPHVFERFYRSDKARTVSKGHTGLGLAICKAIVEAHSGTIEVVSQVDTGTTFTVRLPGASSAQPNGRA